MAESGGEPAESGSDGAQDKSLKAKRDASDPAPPARKGGFALLAGLILVTVLAAGVYLLGKTYFTGTVSETAEKAEARIGGPFTLTNQDGDTVTDQTYAGKYLLVFFGYTFCPDVCPTTLTDLSNVMKQLGPDADKVVPLFITIDPERDTADNLKTYLTYFDPRIQGLTGTPAQIAQVTKEYKAYYKKVDVDPNDPGNYQMDHSSIVYLMGPHGRFRTHFSYGTRVDAMAEAIRREIGKGT